MKNLRDISQRKIDSILRKNHIFMPIIVRNWRQIVGEKIFHYKTVPHKICKINFKKSSKEKNNSILYIKVPNHSVKLEIYCSKGVMIERIKMFIGFDFIKDIKIFVE
ncbi:MAG TPA: DciA family protein [Candidatus Megaira endosymbiont of Hartmannula sinica]|nr:DciA family protein [Candidatus Megaera endosymbiont of Hartmannula sinica]